MQVRVFEAKDMNSGLKMVKEALGPDALILSTRTVRKGRLGVSGPPVMEITAASEGRQQGGSDDFRITERQLLTSKPIRQAEEEITYADVWEQEQPAPSTAFGRQDNGTSRVDDELRELRALVQGLSSKLNTLEQPPRAASPVGLDDHRLAQPDGDDPVMAYLLARGVNRDAGRMVARFCGDLFSADHHLDSRSLGDLLSTTVSRLFTVKKVLQERTSRQKRISCIGPTGVGKTTTIAKIAANYLSRYGGRVALFTIDTYRIAAVEQLKVYGEIMRMPVEVIINPDGLPRLLDTYRDYDLVLIDTAGRSPRSEMEIREMAAYMPPELDIEHHLLLPASAREHELESMIRTFSILPLSSFIFTKIDECGLLGVLLNVHYRKDIPISFLTNGQRVPEDIVVPDPKLLADLIINDNRTVIHG